MRQVSVGHQTALQLLRRELPSGTVFDVGAFPGTFTRLLAEAGYTVIAFDKEPERGLTIQSRFHQGASLDTAEQTFAELMRETGVVTRAVDIEAARLPAESSSADAVILTEVIEHLFVNPLLALTEANRVLRDGGVLLLSTPNLLSIRNRFNFLRGRMSHVIQPPLQAFLQRIQMGHCGHVRTYAPTELAQWLKSLGFETSFHFYSFDFWDAAAMPDSGVASGPSNASSRGSVLRKLVRSPASYAQAGVATARAILERLVPEFRPHMFVVARKVRAVTFDDLQTLPTGGQEQSAGRPGDASTQAAPAELGGR